MDEKLNCIEKLFLLLVMIFKFEDASFFFSCLIFVSRSFLIFFLSRFFFLSFFIGGIGICGVFF